VERISGSTIIVVTIRPMTTTWEIQVPAASLAAPPTSQVYVASTCRFALSRELRVSFFVTAILPAIAKLGDGIKGSWRIMGVLAFSTSPRKLLLRRPHTDCRNPIARVGHEARLAAGVVSGFDLGNM
jgi:hypothetical protein